MVLRQKSRMEVYLTIKPLKAEKCAGTLNTPRRTKTTSRGMTPTKNDPTRLSPIGAMG